MIKLINVLKSFDGVELYHNLNFEINDGEFVVFSGPSGCGKTTLLNMIGGLEKYDSGQIIIDEWNLNKPKDRIDFYRKGAGFLFQNFALIDNKTVKYNLEIINPKCRSEYSIMDALRTVGLEDKLDTPIYRLSGGEQQRIAVARLLVKKCNIVFADEPTGSLDEANAQKVMELLKIINEKGKTVLLVTHNPEYKKMATRVFDMRTHRFI